MWYLVHFMRKVNIQSFLLLQESFYLWSYLTLSSSQKDWLYHQISMVWDTIKKNLHFEMANIFVSLEQYYKCSIRSLEWSWPSSYYTNVKELPIASSHNSPPIWRIHSKKVANKFVFKTSKSTTVKFVAGERKLKKLDRRSPLPRQIELHFECYFGVWFWCLPAEKPCRERIMKF